MLLGVGASDEAIAALEEELGVSMPAFWAGMMLILLFSITLKWLPVSGPGRLEELDLAHLHLQHGRHGHHH